MKLLTLTVSFFLGLCCTYAQINAAKEKFALPSSLSESSGVIFFNNKLITHNDSGGENKLYELDTISGTITREVTISNAVNTDWEDIAQDETSIYIGDIGNNSGDRTDLKIYKVSKNDFINSSSVMAETIGFSYADQISFTTNPNNTPWDAEALVSFDANNLMLFSKNWVDGTTKGYLIPKTSGNYSVSALHSTLTSEGLITGATYNATTGKLYMVGYSSILQPFVWVCENFSGNAVFSGTNTKTNLSQFAFEQAEAITHVDNNRYFITSESFTASIISDYAKAMVFSTNDVVLSLNKSMFNSTVKIYPNPVRSFFQIDSDAIQQVEIFDAKQVLLFRGNTNRIDMSAFNQGIYFVNITFANSYTIVKKIVKR